MKCHRLAVAMLFSVAVLAPSRGDDKDAGFVPMFNGKDLSGWVNVNCAPGTFFVKDGEIITTGKPTGYLATEKQYENFIADFEWLHVNKKEVGNSGFFVWADPLPAVGNPYTRGIEVQVLVNLEKEGHYTSHGDLFSIHGATCKPDRPHPQGWARCLPSERLCKGGGEWNHYRVTAKDGTIKLQVNGKEVSGVSECKPRKGYLALESEGAECHFRNLKIKELPSSNPKPDEIAELASGFKNLFFGDLSGWKADDTAKKSWQPRDWMLHFDGKGAVPLSTDKEFGDAEFTIDFRFPTKKKEDAACELDFRKGKDSSMRLLVSPESAEVKMISAVGTDVMTVSNKFKDLKPVGQWNRLRATLKDKSFKVTINGKLVEEAKFATVPSRGSFRLAPAGEMSFANLFVRELN